MANEPFPFDDLKAETLRAMVRNLGATTLRTRDKMISFLTAVATQGRDAALETLQAELDAQPPVTKPAPKSKKRPASPGPTTTAKRGRTRAATADDAPVSAAARGRAREPSAKAKEVNGSAAAKETAKEKAGSKKGPAKAAPRARARKGVPKGKDKAPAGDDDEVDELDEDAEAEKEKDSKPKSKRGKAKPKVVLSPRKKSSPRKEEEEKADEVAGAGPSEDADGEPDVGNISTLTGIAAEAVVEEMLARGDIDGGSAPMQVVVDVVTAVQAEPVAGPA